MMNFFRASSASGPSRYQTYDLRLDQVSFRYPGKAPILHQLSLELPAASLGAVIGPNGSGKSTLVRLVANLLKPTTGSIEWNGRATATTPPEELARQIAYVPQTTVMAFPFRVIEVVLSGRTPHTPRFRFDNQSDRDIAMQALETVGAGALAARPITELSGGERQMVALARALAQQPKLLLLDEPSASLDLTHRAALLRTLARLRATTGVSALVVTHDLQLADRLFDRIFALNSGRLLAQGRPDEVLTQPVLERLYGDPHVRTSRIDDRTLIWMES